jgi:hypothetical protein
MATTIMISVRVYPGRLERTDHLDWCLTMKDRRAAVPGAQHVHSTFTDRAGSTGLDQVNDEAHGIA